MSMDTLFEGFGGSMNGFKFDFVRELNLNPYPSPPLPLSSSYSSSGSYSSTSLSPVEADSFQASSTSEESPESSDITNEVLRYINEMLMEEDLEGKTCMLQDSLALQAAEKSFYDVLNQENPELDSRSGGGRKIRQRDDEHDTPDQIRKHKYMAISREETEETDIFDDVLLCKEDDDENYESEPSCSDKKVLKPSTSRTTTKKKTKRREVVDLWSLLTQCAQAVASLDQRTATELLKQIRQHSSIFGDGTQRLAHYFANGLEARMIGTETPLYTHISSKASAADILKAYKVTVSACPFHFINYYISNRTILKLASQATRLHIIDFGICYGFQWPCFIQHLSKRENGPPLLRITGVELPQPGFKPAERVEETGKRLKSYAERFHVPFQYNAIAQKWETITLQDFKLEKGEMVIVNCLNRMKNLPDDTTNTNLSPRDKVFKLINSIQPDLFIHGVVNGTHSAPFFVTRFREALYYFSAFFDMFDATVRREDEERVLFEREIFGNDAVNVIACEGSERVERPETYKQWRVRNLRAGFRQVEMDRELVRKVKSRVKMNYDGDFVVDEDGFWLLQGWKGKILQALSFWKPVG